MTAEGEAIHDGLLPAWEAFSRDHIESGVPCTVVIQPAPLIALFVDEGAARLGAHLELSRPTLLPASPLEEVTVTDVSVDGRRCLEISTSSTGLYRNFFYMLADVAAGVVTDGLTPVAALETSLSNWNALLRHPNILSEERQNGLFGELWLFRRLLPRLGAATLEAWTGPYRQTHDFRLGHNEFEVKTTSGSGRVHIINGLGQLVPSEGFHLYLLSLQITYGGLGGETLAEVIEMIAAHLRAWDGAEQRFNNLLDRSGYRRVDAARYPRRRRLLGPALLVPVVDGCPRLVPSALEELPLKFAPSRIVDATYKIDVAGLGMFDGDPDFLQILPPSNGNEEEGA